MEERRAYERVPSSFKARFLSGSLPYSGTVTNYSENGMCITTGYCLPCDNTLEMLIPLRTNVLKVIVRVRRIVKIDDFNYTLGVELLDPSKEYLELVAHNRDIFRL
jgi:hypothetical protein